MSDYNVFEASVVADSEPDVKARETQRQFAAAVYDARQRCGAFLFGASGLDEFEDRWHYSKKDIRRVVEPTILPVTGVMTRIHNALKTEFKDRLADKTGPDQHIQETDYHSDDDLIPEDNWEGYKDSVDQGGPERVQRDFGVGGDTGRDRHGSRRYADSGAGQVIDTLTNQMGSGDGGTVKPIPGGESVTGGGFGESVTGGGFGDSVTGGGFGPKQGSIALDIYADWARSNGLRVASFDTLSMYGDNCSDDEYRLIGAAIQRVAEDEEGDDDEDHDRDEGDDKGDEDKDDKDSDDDSDDDDDDDDSDKPPWLTGSRHYAAEEDESGGGAPPQEAAPAPAPAAPAAPAAPPAAPAAGGDGAPAQDALLDTADQAIMQMIDQKTQEYQQMIDPLTQAQQAIEFAKQVEQQANPLDVTPPEGTVDVGPADAAPEPDPSQQPPPPPSPQQLQQQAFRIAKHFDMTAEGYNMILGAMSRKHYQTVADAIGGLPPEHRVGIAASLADMFKADNPRFRHEPFLAAAGVDPRYARRYEGAEIQPGDTTSGGPPLVNSAPPGFPSHFPTGMPDSMVLPTADAVAKGQIGASRHDPGSRLDFSRRLQATLNRKADAGTLQPSQTLNSFEFPGAGKVPHPKDNLTVTPDTMGQASGMTTKVKPLTPIAALMQEAKGVMDQWNDSLKQRGQQGLVTDPDAAFEDFSKSVGPKVSPRALDMVKQKVVPGTQPKQPGSGIKPKAASFFTRRVSGWEWNDHQNAYESPNARTFTCACGSQFDTPAYYTCRCGKTWNAFPIGGYGDDGRTASIDKFMCREIMVRPDMIMASVEDGQMPEHETEWVTDEDREDADAPHAPGRTAGPNTPTPFGGDTGGGGIGGGIPGGLGGMAGGLGSKPAPNIGVGGGIASGVEQLLTPSSPTHVADPGPGPISGLDSPKTPSPVQASRNQAAFGDMPNHEIPGYLEHLRGKLRDENISMGELSDLGSLAEAGHIHPHDAELMEAAGVPEEEYNRGANWHPDTDPFDPRQFGAMRKGAPFAEYKDFDDCTSKNSDKDDSSAYCGEIKHRTEDKRSSVHAATVQMFGELKKKDEAKHDDPTVEPKNDKDRDSTLTKGMEHRVKNKEGTEPDQVQKHVKGEDHNGTGRDKGKKDAALRMFGDWTKYDDEPAYSGPTEPPSTAAGSPPPDWARRGPERGPSSQWVPPIFPGR